MDEAYDRASTPPPPFPPPPPPFPFPPGGHALPPPCRLGYRCETICPAHRPPPPVSRAVPPLGCLCLLAAVLRCLRPPLQTNLFSTYKIESAHSNNEILLVISVEQLSRALK